MAQYGAKTSGKGEAQRYVDSLGKGKAVSRSLSEGIGQHSCGENC